MQTRATDSKIVGMRAIVAVLSILSLTLSSADKLWPKPSNQVFRHEHSQHFCSEGPMRAGDVFLNCAQLKLDHVAH